MTTLALITMLTVQTIVTIVTIWFLIKTLHKTNHHASQKASPASDKQSSP